MRVVVLAALTILVMAAVMLTVLSSGDPPAGSQVVQARGRWHNVTYARTVSADGEEFPVVPRVDLSQPQVITLNVVLPDGLTGITVDAAFATVVARASTDDPQQQALLDALVASLEMSEFDESKAPFPYVADPQAGIEPDPASGIVAEGFFAQGKPEGVMSLNFRSRLIVWSDSPEGTLEYSCQAMDKLDHGAFVRLLQAQLTPGIRPVPVDYPEGVPTCVLLR